MTAHALTATDLPFPATRGKVRDVYDVGNGRLLLVATDRISAYDVVMSNGVPGKGILLTQTARFWFDRYERDFPNHLITGDLAADLEPFADLLRGRSMLVKKLDVVPFECVARGYLAGSGWKEYQQAGRVCGVALPAGLRNGDRLPEPIFTPATKAQSGHDQNVSFDVMADALGRDLAADLRDRTLRLYSLAADYAASKGILLADTKFEWGRDAGGNVILADEILTPDSSRFWPADGWRPGGKQPSFDKQFVRDYLQTLDWDRRPPGPVLPPHVVDGTRRRYAEAYEKLAGRPADLGPYA